MQIYTILLYNFEEHNYTTLCPSFSEKCIEQQPASWISARLHPGVRVFAAIVGGEVPLGLLELAVRRVTWENTYNVVPLTGVVWAAVQRELEKLWDVRLAVEEWSEEKWIKALNR